MPLQATNDRLSTHIPKWNDIKYSSMKTRRDVPTNLNSVRGLACLLVVALHVVGDADTNGLHLPMSSGWHYMMESIEFLRMPLFTALSGYLYAGRRVTKQEFSRFWIKKSRRIVIPFIFATFVFWWLRAHALGNHVPLVDALLFEFGHLWYLQALLLLFTVISVADAFFRPGTATIAIAGLVTIMISQSGLQITTFLGLAGSLYLAPYFLFGIILREHPQWLRNPQSGILALGIMLIVLTSQQLGLFGLIDAVTLLQMPAALAGMACVVFLLQRFPNNAVLAHIGYYSYTIYLWHIAASAAVRSGLIKIGVSGVPTLFALSFVAAVVVPIALYQVTRRVPILSLLFTGERPLPNNWIAPSARQHAVQARPR